MGEAYPELTRGARMVQDVVKLEEERFGRTLKQGMKILNEESAGLKAGDTLAGEVAFKLYDTYGFPLDLTADALRSRDITIDEDGFTSEMNAQKQRARAAHKGSGDAAVDEIWFGIQEEHGNTEFQGYTAMDGEAVVQAVVEDSRQTDVLIEGQTGWGCL